MGASRHFSSLYLLVELFFFIPGYYAFKHFQPRSAETINDDANSKFKGVESCYKPLSVFITS